ncbi:unnamed protein product [Rotaria magnacalcarata]|uniref:protein-tyrosine-phosphatase n=2 Tax=Rotaria magnacalcarata TaxID=392030 RepID=A0A816W2I9_9BILA|nr:unnamed protein product [Rotaria magnacalcarata]CAF4031391.1 unnamed protein product [Rotaria magnacalcarata]
MAGAPIRSNVWMIDIMRHYLTNDLQATNEEIDYLKRLCALKSKPREASIKLKGVRNPSTIIDGYLYHGDLGHALNKNLLEELDIRHIVNVCDSPLNKEILDHFNVLWINISDELSTNIRQYFDRTNEFLHACKLKGEKVLVHCQMGISRSSSIILAYLIKYHFDNIYDAYDHLVQCRRIVSPNFGFFLQLIRYESDLHSSKTIKDDHVLKEPIETVITESSVNSNLIESTK